MADNNTETSTRIEQNDAQAPSKTSRVHLLRDVMDKTVKSFIRRLRLVQPLKGVPWSDLQQLQGQVVNQLEANIKSEFEQMYSEENIEHLLNGLDKLVHQNPPAENAKTWRPSGSVSKDMCPAVANLKLEQLKALQNTLSDLEAQNKLLREKMEKKEKRLLLTKDKIVGIVQDLEQITQAETTHKEELIASTGTGLTLC